MIRRRAMASSLRQNHLHTCPDFSMRELIPGLSGLDTAIFRFAAAVDSAKYGSSRRRSATSQVSAPARQRVERAHVRRRVEQLACSRQLCTAKTGCSWYCPEFNSSYSPASSGMPRGEANCPHCEQSELGLVSIRSLGHQRHVP